MSEAGKRLIDGAQEALAIAKGEKPAARVHINGYAYVPEQRWQLIESAPKDGTPILAFNSRHPSHAPIVVKWMFEYEDSDLGPEPHWSDAATAGGTALYFNSLYFDFWMPLPPAPEKAHD